MALAFLLRTQTGRIDFRALGDAEPLGSSSPVGFSRSPSLTATGQERFAGKAPPTFRQTASSLTYRPDVSSYPRGLRLQQARHLQGGSSICFLGSQTLLRGNAHKMETRAAE